ncbi:MAG: ABC transporter permease [Spirochaetales bacterium]|nr:ABC transporter permease [Spirochaetales bacterium]
MNIGIFDSDRWEDIFSHMGKHKIRTFLTAFGVFWGIFLLLLLLGAGSGIENGVFKQFGGVAVNSLHIWGNTTTLPFKGNRPGRWVELTNEDTQAISTLVKGIDIVCPRLRVWWTTTTRYKKKTGSFSMIGTTEDLLEIEPIIIQEGRFINERDIAQERKIAVIGTGVRDILFEKTESPIGSFIDVNGVTFLVAGVFDIESYGGDRRGALETVYLPLSTTQSAFNLPHRIGWYSLLISEGFSAAGVESAVRALFTARHDIDPRDTRAIGSWDSSREYNNLQGLFTGIRLFLWIVGIGTLLAGIVGVSNIMLITVKERTREIGIRKALGATPFSIVSMILQEAFFITSVAGYLGLVAGVFAVEGAASFIRSQPQEISYFSEPEVSISVALAAMGILILSGTLAGLFPALKAAKIHPVIALREE